MDSLGCGKMKNDGGPAFPGKIDRDAYEGIPLRDLLAGMAMIGFIASGASRHGIAKECYEIADTMIKERENDSTS